MTIRDLFNDCEGSGVLVVRDGVEVLMIKNNTILPDQTWFLRIVKSTIQEREALEEAGYLIKEV